MVKLDIELPKDCEECPCSYWIQGGKHDGSLMCNAIEMIEAKKIHRFPENCLLKKSEKPENCPMQEVTE